MPGELLSPPAPGFFGKIPSAGDFVSRGLPDLFRQRWDGWVTRHLAPLMRDRQGWPEGGLRFRLVSGGRVAAGVVIPGADSAGRGFPLSLVLVADALPGPSALDRWCETALQAARPVLAGEGGADDLWVALDGLSPPDGGCEEDVPLLVWTASETPLAAAPDDPGPALDRLIGREP